jgi:hypothetical protein
MTNGKMKDALKIGLMMKISKAGLSWIKRRDPEL